MNSRMTSPALVSRFFLYFLFFSPLLIASTAAQTVDLFGPSDQESSAIVTPEVYFSFDQAYRGGTVQMAVVAHIQGGWHVNSHQPLEEYLIPTEVVFDTTNGARVGKIVYPRALERTFAFSETPLAVYEEEFVVGVELRLPADLPGGELVLAGRLRYQACNDVSCLPPAEVPFRGRIAVVGLDQPANLTHAEVFSRVDFGAAPTAAVEESRANEIDDLVARHGFAAALLFLFLGGLALNLTPCVYPLIPITTSYFGGQTGGHPARVFSLALVYVLGMALTYSVLGVLAASSGALFGAALQSPPVLIFIALVMVALALSMFGLYEFRVPLALTQLAGGARPGYVGALFMGLTVGIVAAPCIGPFVLGLLTYVAALGNPVAGFWMFFVLALGLGVPYLILGTFSGLLQNLPRSGMWMVWVKKIFGVVLLAMAVYFLQPILPGYLKHYLLPAVLLLGGIYVGFVERSRFQSAMFPWFKRLAATAFLAVAVWLAWPEQQAHAQSWQIYSEQALLEAKQQGKPVIVDFTAEWCLACKELEKLTFPHEQVRSRADRFVFLRADLTQYASAPVQAMLQRYQIKGLPTIIFLDGAGNEVADQRVVGFLDGPDFARRMDRIP